jgi:NAD(P)H-dependent FMN reductase
MKEKIRITGIGGSMEPKSSTLLYLQYVLAELKTLGAETLLVDVRDLHIPMYDFSKGIKNAGRDFEKLLGEIHKSDGFIFASPEYHGTISASFKNVIDYFEFMDDYSPPYLTQKPTGCIAIAGAENSGGTTLNTMINIVHSLRGITASNSIAIGSAYKHVDKGVITNESIKRKLKRLAEEVYTLSEKLK